jgi:hypothetical protein
MSSASPSWAPEESQVSDPFVAVFTSPSRATSVTHVQHSTANPSSPHSLNFPAEFAASGEREPLLNAARPKKPFYRARPLWCEQARIRQNSSLTRFRLVPFAIIAALVVSPCLH